MSRRITSVRQFIQLLVREIALCGEDGAAPGLVAQNAIATFSIEHLDFAYNNPVEALRSCWSCLLSLTDEIIFGHTWSQALTPRLPPPNSLEDAIQQNILLFASQRVQFYVLGERPWIRSHVFEKPDSSKILMVLKCIAKARQKGICAITLMQELGLSSVDLHQHLSTLESLSFASSRKCNLVLDELRTCTSLWHLASLPAASLPINGNAYGNVAITCPCISDQDLDLCVSILQKAGGTLTVDDFASQLCRHSRFLDSSVSPILQGQGFPRLEEVLTQYRNVRRSFVFQQSSCRYKVPVLQIYEPGNDPIQDPSYPFQLLPKVPLWLQVMSFIHDCGSTGCTIIDISERLRIPRKSLQVLLDKLGDDEIQKKKQSIGRTRIFVYVSKLTFDQPPSVFKINCEHSFPNLKQETSYDQSASFAQLRNTYTRQWPWHHLNLNDLQSKRLEIMYRFLQLNIVVSLSVLYSHLTELERKSNHEFKISYKTFLKLVQILLPFIEATHVQRSVIMRDGITLILLLPVTMPADDPAIVEAYRKHLALRHVSRTGIKLPLLLGPEPPISKRRKISSAGLAARCEGTDIGDAPEVDPPAESSGCDGSEGSDDLLDDTQDLFMKHQCAYRKLLGIPSHFIRAYLLHAFILSRGLQTVSADILLQMLPMRLLIKIVGIPLLKNDILFKLFQELKSLPAHSMDCETFSRDSLLNSDKKIKASFFRAMNLLLRLSILKRRQVPAFLHESIVAPSHEYEVSQSIIIQHVDPETFDRYSQFGCVYYEPSLCVFSLQNAIELRQLWMFLKHLAPHIDSNIPLDPSFDQSLPNAQRMPDILRYGGVFQFNLVSAPVRKRPLGWVLFRFSGPIIAKLSNFLKNTTDLQSVLETKIFPHAWLSDMVPQVLANELRFEGLEIFIEYKRVYNQQAKAQFFLGSKDDDEDDVLESAQHQASVWNLDSETKLLSFVLLHHSDCFRPGLTPSQEDLDMFCRQVNWQLVSRFVHEPAVSCRNHFLRLVPCSQFDTAFQAVREKYPEPAANRTVTIQMAQDFANDIRVKILVFSDSFFWQQRDNGYGQAPSNFPRLNEPPKLLLPWRASFNDCLAASLVIKRTFYTDHYDPSVAAVVTDVDSLLPSDRVLAGSTYLASFGATLVPRGADRLIFCPVLRWSNVPKIVSEKLRNDTAPPIRVSLLQKIQNFQNGSEKVPSSITDVRSGIDAAALAVLHMQGLLSFEHKWNVSVSNESVIQSKKISMLDYLLNQGFIRPIQPRDEVSGPLDYGNYVLLPESDTSRIMCRLNDPDIKVFKRQRLAVSELTSEPNNWKCDFPPEIIEKASLFVHQAASGVDVRQVCDAVGIEVDDAISFRRHLLSVDRSLVSVGNHDLGFLAPRSFVFNGISNPQVDHTVQLWGVQSSAGNPSVKSEVLLLLLRAILKRPGIGDLELAWLVPVIPLSDIRDLLDEAVDDGLVRVMVLIDKPCCLLASSAAPALCVHSFAGLYCARMPSFSSIFSC